MGIFKSVNLLNHKIRTIDKFEAARLVAMVIIVLIIARIATVVKGKQIIDSILK